MPKFNGNNFFQRWLKGMKDSSPVQTQQAMMAGHVGSAIGTAFATGFLIFYGYWYFSILMAFTIFLQLLEFNKARNSVKQLKKIDDYLRLSEVVDSDKSARD